MKVLINERLSKNKMKTSEGYLICTDAILARTGKQQYRKSEVWQDCEDSDAIIDVDRPYNEVFSETTLASFENKPVTLEHPDVDVNSSNWKDYQVGFVRDVRQAKVDGQDVIIGNLVIQDKQVIDEILNGEHTDLSCGYDCNIVEDENGGYSQVNIKGNHVALCQQGRAGIARIVDSIQDATMTCKVGADYDERQLPWFERKFKIKAEPIFKNGEIVAVKFTGTKEQLDKLWEYGYDAPIKDSKVENDSIKDEEYYTYTFEYDVYEDDYKPSRRKKKVSGRNAYEAASKLNEKNIDIIRVYKDDKLLETFTSRKSGEWHGRGNIEQLKGLDNNIEDALVDQSIVDTSNYVENEKGVWFARAKGESSLLSKAYCSSDNGQTWHTCTLETKSSNNDNRTQTGKYIFRTSQSKDYNGPRTSIGRNVLTWCAGNGVHKLGNYEIDHINGDFTDDRLSNLERVTHSENIKRMLANKKDSINDGHNVRTVEWLDDDVYVEYDIDEKKYYLASDNDRYSRTNFDSVGQASAFYKYHKNDVRQSILDSSINDDSTLGYPVVGNKEGHFLIYSEKEKAYLGNGDRSWIPDKDSSYVDRFNSKEDAEKYMKRYVYAKYKPVVVKDSIIGDKRWEVGQRVRYEGAWYYIVNTRQTRNGTEWCLEPEEGGRGNQFWVEDSIKAKDYSNKSNQIYLLCKKYDFYTRGTVSDYNNLLNNADKMSLDDIARDILEHSNNKTLVNLGLYSTRNMMDFITKNTSIKDSFINDVEPRSGETEEEFIKRFMEEMKSEYPDHQQRLAVAYSYWRNKNMKDMKDSYVEITIGQNYSLNTEKFKKEMAEYGLKCEFGPLEGDSRKVRLWGSKEQIKNASYDYPVIEYAVIKDSYNNAYIELDWYSEGSEAEAIKEAEELARRYQVTCKKVGMANGNPVIRFNGPKDRLYKLSMKYGLDDDEFDDYVVDSIKDSLKVGTIVVKDSSGEQFNIVKIPGDGFVYLESRFDGKLVKTYEDSFKEKYKVKVNDALSTSEFLRWYEQGNRADRRFNEKLNTINRILEKYDEYGDSDAYMIYDDCPIAIKEQITKIIKS